ncbi:MAG: GNAT family N-acetyltransferase [Chitinophagaceae bacterium]
MNDNLKIRLIQTGDYSAVLNIYGPYVQNTAISFEYDIPPLSEFSKRIENITSFYPWLVAEIDNHIVGYAYASKHRSRNAYDWSVESSVYLLENYHRMGIAKELYTKLFEPLRLQGIVNVYAGITLPNIKSESFHAAMNFKPVGIYHKVGYKNNQWHDVLWMELALHQHNNNPPSPLSIEKIKALPEFTKTLIS